MTGHPALPHNKSTLREWLGTNRGTHWTVAGSVAVIIFGSYLIFNSHGGSHPANITAAERATAPVTPGPSPSKQ